MDRLRFKRVNYDISLGRENQRIYESLESGNASLGPSQLLQIKLNMEVYPGLILDVGITRPQIITALKMHVL
jgi:hypothetical protein